MAPRHVVILSCLSLVGCSERHDPSSDSQGCDGGGCPTPPSPTVRAPADASAGVLAMDAAPPSLRDAGTSATAPEAGPSPFVDDDPPCDVDDAGVDDDAGLDPRCERIAFAFVRCEPVCNLYVMNRLGRTILVDDDFAWAPYGWSPDGSTLAFGSGRNDDTSADLYVSDPDGQNQRRVTSGPFAEEFVGWLPNGHEIAFISDRNAGVELWAIDVDGTNERLLASLPRGGLSLSPDGSQLASDGRELWVMKVDGSEARMIAPAESNSGLVAAWSPDGTKLAFGSDASGNPEIHVIGVDGSGETRLTMHPEEDHSPSWSGDGRKLVFVRDFDLYTMNADGTNVRLLLDDTADVTAPRWRP